MRNKFTFGQMYSLAKSNLKKEPASIDHAQEQQHATSFVAAPAQPAFASNPVPIAHTAQNAQPAQNMQLGQNMQSAQHRYAPVVEAAPLPAFAHSGAYVPLSDFEHRVLEHQKKMEMMLMVLLIAVAILFFKISK